MKYTPVIIALESRLVVILIQLISNWPIPDHEANAYIYPGYKEAKSGSVVFSLLDGFMRWDAQYFIHIARYGYSFENMLAFFPLYPLLVRSVGGILSTMLPVFINIDSVLLFSACLINIVLFCLTARCLYKFTGIFFSECFAYRTVVLFCYNPASIFFSAPYTECLFCYLTFKSMLNCIILYQKYLLYRTKICWKDIRYLTPIALSTITRSNGIINIGFLMYTIISVVLTKRHLLKMKNLSLISKYLLIVLFSILFCLLPFILFQVYAYRNFCSDFTYIAPRSILSFAEKNKLILQGQHSKHLQSWCSNVIPLSYSYVQSKYWNVGFLKYYQLRQIPNFLLATQIILVVMNYVVRYFYRNFKLKRANIFTFNRSLSTKNNNIYHPIIFVYITHVFFLTIFLILFVHIQICTRMVLSASPVVYWYCAYQFLGAKLRRFSSLELFLCKSRNTIIIKTYFITYFLIGIALFTNFLPWT